MFENVKVLTFDVGGSVFDWQTSTQDAVNRLAKERSVELDVPKFCLTWRRRMFECLAEVRSGTRPWQNADALHRTVLDELADQYPDLALTPSDRDDLNEAWHRMGVWPDVPEALSILRQHYIVSILTVLSTSIVVDSSKHSGIDWDAYISCELLGVYKPEAEAYRRAAELFRVKPEETMMIAVHPGDLRAAQRAGLRTGYVKPKVWEMGADGDNSGFDVSADDYLDLAHQLCDESS